MAKYKVTEKEKEKEFKEILAGSVHQFKLQFCNLTLLLCYIFLKF